MIGSGDAQLEHGFQVGFFPPGTGKFEALLDDVTVATLNLTRANGKLVVACGRVVQVVLAFSQVPAGVPHWRVGCGFYFLIRLHALEHLFGLIV